MAMNAHGENVPDELVARIKKLLALSTSSNENEAALAAAKAQELLFKYELEMSSVEKFDLDEKPVEEQRIVINDGHRGVNWKVEVFGAVVKTSMCTDLLSWYTSDYNRTVTTGYIIGRPADIEMVKYTFSFLVSELQRLCDVFVANYTGYDHRTRVRNSWLTGAAKGVSSKLWFEFNERRGQSQETMALVLNKDAAIQAWMGEHYPKLHGSYTSQTSEYFNGSAYRAGYETGRHLGTARALGDGSSTKRIDSGR